MRAEAAITRFPAGRTTAGRAAAGFAALVVFCLGAFGLRDPLASMVSYTTALMALNQIAPPLLLLALPSPAGAPSPWATLLDSWVGTIVFVGLSVAVSLPGVFDPSVANALYAAPLGLFELIAGLLFWAQFMPATRVIRRSWVAGLLAWAGGVPMTVVALIWMLSPDLLYTPYLDVICRWDISPLADQRWAGLVMFVAGAPLQMVGVWFLLGLGPSGEHVGVRV